MKKIAAFICMMCVLCANVSAYYFPEPDWGALLNEKKKMVNETDFELYMEGPIEAAPYFGAKLEQRGGVHFGMVAENSEFLQPISSYLTYLSIDYGETDIYFPANQIIREKDCVATVALNTNSLSGVDFNNVRRALDNLAKYEKPMFIRFANEMNVSALGDEPAQYIAIFRKVADMIHEYPNFSVVWSPNDMGALDRPFDYYYPGDAYVDWVGVSSYMKQYFMGNKNTDPKNAVYFMTGDYAWATNALKPIVSFMEKNGIQKPIMLSECGVSTETKYGNPSDSWASPRFRNLYYNVIMKYPQVKMINYFNVYRNEAERFYVKDYDDTQATDKEYAMYIMREALESGAYIRKASEDAAFAFVPANAGYTAYAPDGKLSLYTLAHVPGTPYMDVHYYVDGEWFGMGEASPYKCDINLGLLADGDHTVKIVSGNLQKAYTFTKRGNAVCFGGEPDMSYVKQPEIRVMLNGEEIAFDVPPQIIEDRTMVPLRAIFEALGATVTWDAQSRTVWAERAGTEIRLTVDENVLYVNGKAVQLDVAARIVDGRTLVPVRAVSESFHCVVEWEADTRTVWITE